MIKFQRIISGYVLAALFSGSMAISMFSCSSGKGDDKDSEETKASQIVSDEGTEQKIEGTWSYSDSYVDDGVSISENGSTTYTLSSHEFVSELTMYAEGHKFCEATVSGTWSADKEYIMEKYDFSNAQIEVSPYFADDVSADELKQELMSEKNSMKSKIVSLAENEMTLEDEDGEKTVYYRR